MFRVSRLPLYLSTVLLASTVSHAAFAAQTNYSRQNDLIGATSVMASANYGAGTVIGSIDTGVVPWIGFSPTYNGLGVSNIDTANSGACLNGVCTAGSGYTDDNGHGTFTISEMAGGIRNNPNAFMSGVAPAASMVAVKVLNAQGSGTNTDVINGIRYAADHGVKVMNLSLGPGGSSSQQASFYSSLAGAVNYAASKGVYVVFAGGNSNQNLAGNLTISGFTSAAIQHTLFVGATDFNKKIASYSNKPGTGKFVSTTGQSTSYKNRWVMAVGGSSSWFTSDPVYGASNSNSGQCAGYGCITTMVGTSMAAPEVTGGIALLITRWPVLITNGTAADVLAQTATDLGSKGIDNTYGSGFLNLVKAFQPVGGTYALTKNGGTVAVNGRGGNSTLTGGALGSMPGITAVLSNYNIFDEYQRDFGVNLSGLVATRTSASPLAQSITAPKVVASSFSFKDGSNLAFSSVSADDSVNIEHPSSVSGGDNFVVSFTDAAGSVVATGRGIPASASFTGALWGNDNPVSGQIFGLAASNALQNLAQGGHFAAYGTQVATDTRMAFSWSGTESNDSMGSTDWSKPNASAFAAGVTHQFTPAWTAGLTVNLLDETSGLLGTTYAESGPVSFGGHNHSTSFGATSAIKLSPTSDLVFDASIVRTDGAQFENSIISDVTPIYARTAGASLVERDTWKKGDNLAFTVRAPLRVYSGSAGVALTSVDESGVPSTANQRVGLKPDGNELDFSLGYQVPVNDRASVSLTFNHRQDADNIQGVTDNGFLVASKLRF